MRTSGCLGTGPITFDKIRAGQNFEVNERWQKAIDEGHPLKRHPFIIPGAALVRRGWDDLRHMKLYTYPFPIHEGYEFTLHYSGEPGRSMPHPGKDRKIATRAAFLSAYSEQAATRDDTTKVPRMQLRMSAAFLAQQYSKGVVAKYMLKTQLNQKFVAAVQRLFKCVK